MIDAVGVDANRPHSGPASAQADQMEAQFEQQMKQVAPKNKTKNGNWHQGDAPGQAVQWEVEAAEKGGTLSIIGVYPQTAQFFPIGLAMSRQLKINMGNCNHRKYIPSLVSMVAAGLVNPEQVLTEREPMTSAIDAYKAFDEREDGWVKVELVPSAMA